MKKYIICSRLLNNEFYETHPLHSLCRILNDMGQQAYMLYPGGQIIFTDYKLPTMTLMSACHSIYYNNDIVIYPNNFKGNYLNAKNIVRLVLSDDVRKSYPKREKIYYYDESFMKKNENKESAKLFYPVKEMPSDNNVISEMGISVGNFIRNTQC